MSPTAQPTRDGLASVGRRRATARPGWTAIEADDLARTGTLFLPCDTGSLGFAAYSHRAIVDLFDPILTVEAIYAGLLADAQDLVVLRRPAAPQRKGWGRSLESGRSVWRRLAGARPGAGG